MALLVYQVSSKNKKVGLLFVDQADQFLHRLGMSLPTAYMDVRQLDDAIAVKSCRKPGWGIFYLFYFEACDSYERTVSDAAEADGSQNNAGQGEREAWTRLDECMQQVACQGTEHKYRFRGGKQHQGNSQAADALSMVRHGIVTGQIHIVDIKDA